MLISRLSFGVLWLEKTELHSFILTFFLLHDYLNKHIALSLSDSDEDKDDKPQDKKKEKYEKDAPGTQSTVTQFHAKNGC